MEEFIQKLTSVLKFPVEKSAVFRIKRDVMYSVKEGDVRDLLGHMHTLGETEMSFGRMLSGTLPAPRFAAALKERLLNFIELKNRRRPFFTWRRRMVFALSFFVLFVGVFAYLSREDLAKAQHLTYLSGVSGDVFIQRDGTVYRAGRNMVLREGDIVRTAENGRATVQFFDDSVSRLDADTEVSLEHLSVNPLNTTNTVIALNLRKGRAYNRVISLVGDKSKFTVNTSGFAASATTKAAFDVSVRGKETNVTSLNNSVAVEVISGGGKKERKSLTEGTKATIVKESVSASGVAAPSVSLPRRDSDEVWIEENLKEDEEYIAHVQAAAKAVREREAGILPGNVLYPVKVLAEKADMFLTFDKAEKSRKKLEVVKQKLVEAQVLLERGDLEDGKVLLEQFKTAVTDVAKDAESQTPVLEENLKAKITEALEQAKKDMAPVLPDSQLYEAKTALKEAELQIVSDDKSAVVQKKIQQAQDSVAEAKDLADKKQPDLARESLKKFSEQVSEVVSDVSLIPDAAKSAVLEDFAERKEQVTSVLDGLSKKSDDLAPDAFSARQSLETVLDQAVTESKESAQTRETLIIENVKVDVQSATSPVILPLNPRSSEPTLQEVAPVIPPSSESAGQVQQ